MEREPDFDSMDGHLQSGEDNGTLTINWNYLGRAGKTGLYFLNEAFQTN